MVSGTHADAGVNRTLKRGMPAADLVCDECGAVSKDAAGWKAALADAPLEDGPIGVAIYCPACWAREFDEDEP